MCQGFHFVSVSMIFLLDFRTVLMEWYFFRFPFYSYCSCICVLGVLILPLFLRYFELDFGTVIFCLPFYYYCKDSCMYVFKVLIFPLFLWAVVVMISWQLHLQLPVQSVTIATKVVSLNPTHGEVYSIQHVIKFVNDLRQVDSFLQFPTQIKLTATI